MFTESTLVKYARNIRATPREVIFNRNLILTSLIYALAGIPLSEYSLSPIMQSYRALTIK